jgi:AcrR family transcriptional regulator
MPRKRGAAVRRATATLPSIRARGVRPSGAAAAQLRDRILDAATELFFAQGFGATSIDAVAKRARISKRTFYHRFGDKAALFGAVLHRIVQGLRPPAAMPLVAGADLRAILLRLARIILHAALMPQALALHRLIVGESARFPRLAAAVAADGASAEAVTLIAELLARETRAGTLAVADPFFAAEQFLQMVLGVPRRRALGLGKPMRAAELDRWASGAVDLFLDGCGSRTAGSSARSARSRPKGRRVRRIADG